MSGAQALWTAYKALLEGGAYAAWADLWVGNGEFVVVYGDETFDGCEQYDGVSKIVAFISANADLIHETRILNDEVYPIENGGGDFFCCFDIRIMTTDDDDYVYENRIICRFETKGGRIARIVEYAHPLLRRRFITHLKHLRSSSGAG